MTSSIKFPWKVCGKNVNDSDLAIQCDLCDYWIYLNSNNFNYITINFFKILMILGILFPVAVKFFHLNLRKVIKLFHVCE